jgi:hypothetical protein
MASDPLAPRRRVAMADLYEFRVSGLIGPVLRSALPELTAEAGDRQSVLTGTATTPDAVDTLLRQLQDAGLTESHILIATDKRWHATPEQ